MDVKDFFGAIVVEDGDDEGTRRWWFDRTDEGRLVFCAEVLVYSEDYSIMTESEGRHYVDQSEMDVPASVREALDAEGFLLPPVDMKGREV